MDSQLSLDEWRLKGDDLKDLEQAINILTNLVDGSRKLGIREAWKIIRSWLVESEKIQLYERVLGACLGINATNKPVSSHLLLLLSQPFTSLEDEIINNFLLTTPLFSITQLPLALDWRISKLIAEGRFIEALRFSRDMEGATGFITTGAEARSKILTSIRENLTEVQRQQVDLEIESAMNFNAPSTSTLPITAPISNPSWQPQATLPKNIPTSLSFLYNKSVPISIEPLAIDLPLSASPHLRQTIPQVSSKDGSSLGGAQKSVLLAREKGKGKLPSLSNLSTTELGSPRKSLDSPTKKSHTLAGFGSNRLPPTPRLTFNQDQEIRDLNLDQEQTMSFAPSREESPDDSLSFTQRVLLNPDISATLKAAATPKRRTTKTAPTEKRRAVSTEVEDRPSSTVQIFNGIVKTLPPGAFPGQELETDQESEIIETPRKERVVRGAKKSTVGRIKVKKVVEKVETPRRSTRLGIKERERELSAELEEEVMKKSKRSTRSRDD